MERQSALYAVPSSIMFDYKPRENKQESEKKDDRENDKDICNMIVGICFIRKIIRLTDEGISPTFYHLLNECPPTSISVERSFSMLEIKTNQKSRHLLMSEIYLN